MYIIDLQTNKDHLAQITKVVKDDLRKLTVKRYAFNWKQLKNERDLYKLTIKNNDDILGLICFTEYHDEERIEIKLLMVSSENIGHKKQYDRIAGCLIAFACREAIRRYKNYPAVSLIPKTELRQHYINAYGMVDAGWQLYLEDIALTKLIEKYL